MNNKKKAEFTLAVEIRMKPESEELSLNAYATTHQATQGLVHV